MKLQASETEPGAWGVDLVDASGSRWSICECDHADADTAFACANKTLEDHGRIAFEAYNDAVGGKPWDGKPIPGWDAVTDKVRDGWRTAAIAARKGQRP